MACFNLRLEDTYWSKGFFNVSVDFQRFLTSADGPLDIFLGDAAQPVRGRVSRSANRNATPRVYGNKALIEFFQAHCRRGGLVRVEIISPTAIRVGGTVNPEDRDEHQTSSLTPTRGRVAMPGKLEAAFNDAMLDIYRRAKSEAHYTATRFRGMVVERGGVKTARYLLHAATVSDGYTALWERERLDLSVEALILEPKWRALFSDAERQIAVTRLREYGFRSHLPDGETE